MTPPTDEPALCVLSSSSSGNCSALVLGRGRDRRLLLIDAGLSPRRTRTLLEAVGAGGLPIAGLLLTHLDHDHWNPNWVRALPPEALVWLHRSHRARGERSGVLHRRTEVYQDDFEPAPGVRVRASVLDHDDQGVAVFRATFDHGGSLGYATDVGRPTPGLISHLRGVDVLALESNYCPAMQQASGRPRVLIDRIMGGRGHLSNDESAYAAARIAPTTALVLLHLSRQCNRPEVACAAHARSPVPVTPAPADAPTAWVPVPPRSSATPEVRVRQLALFGASPPTLG